MILGQKLTLNHASLIDEGEKTRVLVTDHRREMGRVKRKLCDKSEGVQFL